MLSTMCGHGMISHSLAKKMIDFVKENRRTPDAGGGNADPILLVRRVQSRPREAHPRRCPHKDCVAGSRSASLGPRRWSRWAAVGSGCAKAADAPAGAGCDALVFRNFTLIDGGDRAPLPQAAMVVRTGRMSWVGPAADLKAPDGATVTDLNGAYVIPGLIDLHAHIGNTVDLVQDKSKFHTRDEHREGPEDICVVRRDDGPEHGHGPGHDLSRCATTSASRTRQTAEPCCRWRASTRPARV